MPHARTGPSAYRLLFCACLLLIVAGRLPVSVSAADPPKPAPTHADVSFGPHPHQLLDIYLPPNPTSPSPVLVWYGGLWQPSKHAPNLGHFAANGCAVVAVQSRTLTDAVEDKAVPPISYPMNDACRAVQFVRLHAREWRIDPRRIAVGGGSQGSLPALYVGCAEERANPASADPVEQQSTQVVGVAAFRSQPTIDPKRMQEWVPGVAWGAPALGCGFVESLKRREELLPTIAKWSPDHLLHSGVPPIYFENEWGLTQPADVTKSNYDVHSPAWGLGFQKLAQAAGVTCYVKHKEQPTPEYKDTWDFLVKRLQSNP